MRLIDADALPYDEFLNHRIVMWEDIERSKTIDAVPVIRCKDCRWGREVCGNIECSVDRNLPPEYHGYEWFCPNGEKMDEVNK